MVSVSTSPDSGTPLFKNAEKADTVIIEMKCSVLLLKAIYSVPHVKRLNVPVHEEQTQQLESTAWHMVL